MIIPTGVKINGKSVYDLFGLILSSYNIAPPEVKQNFVSVPGRNGDLDFSEALTGYPLYGNRLITLTLGGKMSRKMWFQTRTNVLNSVHNKQVQLIFDEDDQFFWQGRATVQDDFSIGQQVATFSVQINAQPYKLELRDGGSAEGWLWDPFNFLTGIIREYYRIQINGFYTLNIAGLEMPVIPEFTVTESADLSVEYEEKKYMLQDGINKFYSIITKRGDNIFTFSGKGIVTVNYRGGEL